MIRLKFDAPKQRPALVAVEPVRAEFDSDSETWTVDYVETDANGARLRSTLVVLSKEDFTRAERRALADAAGALLRAASRKQRDSGEIEGAVFKE